MKKSLLISSFLIFCSNYLLGQGEFITKWKLPSNESTIQFYITTDGLSTYEWETIPAGSSGVGSSHSGTVYIYNLPLGSEIIVKIAPQNIRSFFIYDMKYKKYLVDVIQWGSVKWQTMAGTFEDCINISLITANDVPDLSNATSLENMFRECINLKSVNKMEDWNVSNISNMSYMFRNADSFNQNLNNWDTRNVVNMQSMFQQANSFNIMCVN